MKLSHYIYGRSEQDAYNNPGKFSADYNTPGYDRSFMKDVVGHTRDLAGFEGGTVELKNTPDPLAANGVRSRLCYSEYVTTVDRLDDGIRREIRTRPYGYSHYIFPYNVEEDRTLSGREAFQYSLELQVWNGLLMDKHAYQQEMEKPGQWLDEDAPQDILLSDISKCYQQVADAYVGRLKAVADDFAARGDLTEDRRGAYLEARFSAENLGAFLARYWEHCDAQNRGRQMPALTLLATSSERNRSTHPMYDPKNVTRDGVIFFHDHVVPHLPEAVCRIVSVRFGVQYEENLAISEGRSNACIVCFPSNAAYNQEVVYCPFEDAVYDDDLTTDELLLGQAMLNKMPESYLLLEQHQEWKAASNYNTALQMVALSFMCENGVNNVEDAYKGAMMLQTIRENMQDDGIRENAKLDYILYSLEMHWANACLKVSLPFNQGLYTVWTSNLARLTAPNAYLTKEQLHALREIYSKLATGSLGQLNDGALYHMAANRKEATQEAELALLKQRPYQGEFVTDEAVIVFLTRIQSLKVEGELAEAYIAFLTERFAAPLAERGYKDCLVLGQERRRSLRCGSISPENLCCEWLKDREQLLKLQRFAQQLAVVSDLDLIEALEWYGQRKNRQLSESIQSILEPLVLQLLSTDSDTSDRRELIRAYTNSLWSNTKIDRQVLGAIKAGGSFHDVIADQHLLNCANIFFSNDHHSEQQRELFGILEDKQRETVKADLTDLKLIPAWPLEQAQAVSLIAALLCDQSTYQLSLGQEELLPLTRIFTDQQSMLTLSTAIQQRLQAQLEFAPALAQERAAVYLDFLSSAGLTRTDAFHAIRGCFDRLLPPTLPEPSLQESLERVLNTYVINGEPEVVQAVEKWCTHTMEGILRMSSKNNLPDVERMGRLTELLNHLGGNQERVLLDTVKDRSIAQLVKPMSRGEFPLPEAQGAVIELLAACGFVEQVLCSDVQALFEGELFPKLRERHVLPNQQDIDSLRGMYQRFGVDSRRSDASLKAWISDSVMHRTDVLDEGFATDFAAAVEAAGFTIRAFAESSYHWLTSVVNRYLRGRNALPDSSFLEDLKNHCRIMDVDAQRFKPHFKDACGRAFAAMPETELPDSSMDKILEQLMQNFGMTSTDFCANLKECIGRFITHLCEGCETSRRLPEVEDIHVIIGFCEAHGLEWKRICTPLEETCKRAIILRCQENEPVSADFLEQLSQCDEALGIQAQDRSAVLRDWMKKTIDRADHTALPEKDLLDALNTPAYNTLFCGDRSLTDKMVAWLQYGADQAGKSDRTACMQCMEDIFKLSCTDERFLNRANNRWTQFFLGQETEALREEIAGSESVDQLIALGQCDHAQHIQQLFLSMEHMVDTTDYISAIRGSVYDRMNALQVHWKGEMINALMRKSWFSDSETLLVYEQALCESFQCILREGGKEKLALSLQVGDVMEKVDTIRRWQAFVNTKGISLRNEKKFIQLERVYKRCNAFETIAQSGNWQERLPDMIRRLAAYEDPELDEIGDSYALQVLADLDPVGRKLPILMRLSSVQDGSIHVRWENFLNKAYPLVNNGAWDDPDLLKSGSGAFPVISALLLGFQDTPDLKNGLMEYLNHSSFGIKAKAKAKTRLRRIANLTADQLSPVLQWLLDKN